MQFDIPFEVYSGPVVIEILGDIDDFYTLLYQQRLIKGLFVFVQIRAQKRSVFINRRRFYLLSP